MNGRHDKRVKGRKGVERIEEGKEWEKVTSKE
jgi:hypothetical protein